MAIGLIRNSYISPRATSQKMTAQKALFQGHIRYTDDGMTGRKSILGRVDPNFAASQSAGRGGRTPLHNVSADPGD
jgi:hypothetical protein